MKCSPIMFTLLMLVVATTTFAVDCTIMSFNVRYGTAKDGENAWEHRRDFLVETIKEASPDIVGTQECLDFQADYITENLPGYAWIGLGRERDGSGEMTAIIYRKSVLVPVETTHRWLSETPDIPGSKSWDTSLTRIVSRVKFFHIAEKTPFIVYNTHFDHRGRVARNESAKLLVDLIRAETLPVMLTGDFNAQAGTSAPWRTLTEGGLRDTWEVAVEQQGPANTWNGFEIQSEDGGRRIDWIMVSPGLSTSRCAIIDTPRDGRYPSDHFPVIATLSFPSKAAQQ
jgi:endonuclease/exonuclease/phosphatase family metal-dependent hydrolase